MTRIEGNLLDGEAGARPLALPASPGPAGPPRRGLAGIIWRRRLILLLVVLAAAAGGFAYIQLATPIFPSTSRIYVQQTGPKIMGAEDAGAGSRSANFLSTECQLIRSGPILAAALEAPGIRDLRTFAGVEGPLGHLAKNLTAGVGKNDDLISVSFESPYPDAAAQVVNAVVDAYVAYQSSRRRTTAAEVLKILQKEKNKRDAELETGLRAMLDFKQNHGELGFEGEKGNIIIQRLDRLSTALTEAELELVEAKATYDALSTMKDDPGKIRQFFETKRAIGGVFINTQDEDSRLQAELNGLQMQLQILKRQYATTHPAVASVEANIAAVRQQIAEREVDFAKRHLVVIQQQYEAASQKEQRIQAAYEQQLKDAQGLNKVMADYARLQNAWEQGKKIVEILDSRIKELNITEDVGALNISVLETAGRPDKPVRPEPIRVMLIALALGLLVGIGLALLRDWADPRLTSAEEISIALGVPVVGVVPRMKGKKDLVSRGQNVLQSPRSPVAEAFRGVRMALTFGLPRDQVRTILVTSPAANDGKSTLISNLAVTTARAGQHTLILDADFLRPRQQEIFQMADQKGLSNVLAGDASLEETIRRDFVNGLKGLDVLPAGLLPSNPSELLNGPAFAGMIKNIAERYDLVLIDSPPVMSATDSLVLAALCDVTLLVVRAEKSPRRVAEQTRQALQSVGARVFGAVVNAVPGKGGRYGSYVGYYRSYGRKETADAETAIAAR